MTINILEINISLPNNRATRGFLDDLNVTYDEHEIVGSQLHVTELGNFTTTTELGNFLDNLVEKMISYNEITQDGIDFEFIEEKMSIIFIDPQEGVIAAFVWNMIDNPEVSYTWVYEAL